MAKTGKRKVKINYKRMFISSTILILIIVAIVLLINRKTEKKQLPEENAIQNTTEVSQQGLNFSNIEIKKDGANTLLTGTLENTKENAVDTRLEMRLYHENNQLAGVSQIRLEDIPSKEKKDFEISLMGDFTVCEKYRVIVVEVIDK